MSKLSLAVCAVLLALVACEKEAESESEKKFGLISAACVDSVKLASSRVVDLYYNSVDQLPNPEDKEIMTDIAAQAVAIFEELIPMANSANTDEVASTVESAFGDVVNCPKSLADYVRVITKHVVDQFDELLQRSQ